MNKKPGSIRIFIGHDSKYPQASKVCKASIRKFWPEARIDYLDKEVLKKAGVYGRKDVEGESTEFSFTRFYVPLLMNYDGYAMFCDNDFLWRVNPQEITRYMGESAISVVKHEDCKVKSSKMDGVVNKSYPKKNWSSLMLFNCNKLKNKLSKD